VQPALPPLAAAPVPNSGPHTRLPLPGDDDPLTSPSFPAINTSDSRSYRGRRSKSSGPGDSQPPAGYSDRSPSLPSYPAAGDHAASGPNGYPVQPPAASAAPSHSPAAPVANPYGSFVGSAQPSYSDPAGELDAVAYGTGFAAGRQAVADVNWYSDASDGQSAGYLPAPPSSGNGHSSSGYSASDLGINYSDPAYTTGQPAQPGGNGQHGYLPSPYDNGYRAPEPGYDSYQGQPGYGSGAQ
jgi:hypothetical protein